MALTEAGGTAVGAEILTEELVYYYPVNSVPVRAWRWWCEPQRRRANGRCISTR